MKCQPLVLLINISWVPRRTTGKHEHAFVTIVAKSAGCFQRRLFVCLFVCQYDNFRTSKHRMMKLGSRCSVRKSRQSSNLGVIATLGACSPKCAVWLRRWENKRRLSSFLVLYSYWWHRKCSFEGYSGPGKSGRLPCPSGVQGRNPDKGSGKSPSSLEGFIVPQTPLTAVIALGH